MFKIKDAEQCQTAAALRRKASELEIEVDEFCILKPDPNPNSSCCHIHCITHICIGCW